MERELFVGETLYLPLIDDFNSSMVIYEVKITKIYEFNSFLVKAVPKLIWSYGDATSLKNKFKISNSDEFTFSKKKLFESIQESIVFLENEKNELTNRIKIKKSELAEEVAHLEEIIKETKKEIKDLNNVINRNINKLKNLDIKEDLMKRGLIDYEQ